MKLVRFLLLAVHLGVLFLILLTGINRFVAPSTVVYFNYLSLTFPFLVLIYLMITAIWAVLLKKRTFFFLAAVLLFISPVRRWVNCNVRKDKKANLSVFTANGHITTNNVKEFTAYLSSTDYDVIAMQEAGMLQSVQLKKYPYRAAHGLNVLFSRYPVTKSEKILSLEGDQAGNAFCADIVVHGKTVRVFNIYLNPFFLRKEMVKPTRTIETNEEKYKTLARKLAPNFVIHQRELATIMQEIKSSPYPVIVAGDLNAVPNSYEYYTLSENLRDTFMEAGRGLGTTFHDYKIPIRIDYIFTSKEIEPVSFRTDRSVRLSDHFPSVAELKLPD